MVGAGAESVVGTAVSIAVSKETVLMLEDGYEDVAGIAVKVVLGATGYTKTNVLDETEAVAWALKGGRESGC